MTNQNTALPGWIKLQSYNSAIEADFHAAMLGEANIPTQVLGADMNNVMWFWAGFNPVDVYVAEADVERATEILKNRPADDLEPDEDFLKSPPPTDRHHRPLIVVAAFDNVHDLRDAQIVLASADIPCLAPPLVPRGNRPAGQGKRFTLRVAQDDLQKAQSVLSEEAEEDSDQPRCPNCGSWQVHTFSGLLKGIAELAGKNQPHETAECDVCHYRGELDKFLPHHR
jgi:hypothetical protein